jgi:hypothetical protein
LQLLQLVGGGPVDLFPPGLNSGHHCCGESEAGQIDRELLNICFFGAQQQISGGLWTVSKVCGFESFKSCLGEVATSPNTGAGRGFFLFADKVTTGNPSVYFEIRKDRSLPLNFKLRLDILHGPCDVSLEP